MRLLIKNNCALLSANIDESEKEQYYSGMNFLCSIKND
ncbi:hypothetical protein AsAng_0010520 [Aureispira anguillae]|uniref:Uncharacterized protein n=1 Tax=Aureispira anguillae TaxID=2864201 RepID=A0A916DP67_9BACT|nr:hypothetical protein AsAng_0010520 [Aureispira anguillae]